MNDRAGEGSSLVIRFGQAENKQTANLDYVNYNEIMVGVVTGEIKLDTEQNMCLPTPGAAFIGRIKCDTHDKNASQNTSGLTAVFTDILFIKSYVT